MTTPFNLPENEGNAPFMTNYSKNCFNIPCKGYTKNLFMNQGHRFMLVMPCSHQVVAVTGGARGNERLKGRTAEKIEYERKLNDPTTPTTDSLR